MKDIDYILQQINEMGFLGYMTKYPLNPLSIIFVVILIGVVVLIVNSKVRKRRADQQRAQNPAVATLVFRTSNMALSDDYADNIRIVRLNGEEACWFFAKPTIPAVYLQPGNNTIELYADWARGKGSQWYQTEPVVLTLTAQPGCSYSLEYNIVEKRYIFEWIA